MSKHLNPEDYKMIKAWHIATGSLPYYWQNLQQQASVVQAPVNSLFFDQNEMRWFTFDELPENNWFRQVK